MRDPYQVLGLTKTASASDIKSSFRKLAKKYHPDQSKEPKAKERFAEISAAYEIIGDEKKRGAFDRGEIDAEGKPRAPQFEGFGAGRRGEGGFNFDFGGGEFSGARGGGIDPDIIAELFGGRGAARGGARRGEDVAATVTVPLATAVHGGSARVTLPSGKSLDIDIPAGVEDGKAMRLRGQGGPAPRGGQAGDALVTIRFAPHPLFKVDGRDLRIDFPITLYEAVLGAKVRLPTVDGAVEMAIPPGTSSGRVLRLRGKGLPPTAELAQGDLLATLRIALPAEEDPELGKLMREWREKKPYDPRAGFAG